MFLYSKTAVLRYIKSGVLPKSTDSSAISVFSAWAYFRGRQIPQIPCFAKQWRFERNYGVFCSSLIPCFFLHMHHQYKGGPFSNFGSVLTTAINLTEFRALISAILSKKENIWKFGVYQAGFEILISADFVSFSFILLCDVQSRELFSHVICHVSLVFEGVLLDSACHIFGSSCW